MECYSSDSQSGGVQFFVLEGFGLLKPDSTWMDSIHFHRITLTERPLGGFSYYPHFTLKEVASSHGSPGHEPETVTTPLHALKTPRFPGECVLVRCKTSKIAMQEGGRQIDSSVSFPFAFVKPCFLFSACTMRVKRKELPSHNPHFQATTHALHITPEAFPLQL